MIFQGRDDSAFDQGGSSGGGKKQSSDFSYIFKEKTIGFPGGLDVGCERKRINKDYSKVLVEKMELNFSDFIKIINEQVCDRSGVQLYRCYICK